MRAALLRNDRRCRSGCIRMLLAAAACSLPVAALAQPATHTVVIEAMRFAPPVLAVHAGDTVKWINKDPFPHNATALDGSFHSPDIAPNGSWSFKVQRTGTFPYACTLHPTMKATLVVK